MTPQELYARRLSKTASYLFSSRSRMAQQAIFELEAPRPDFKKVLTLIQKGANPNERQANGDSLLKTAIASGNLDVVAALIDKGADANETDSHGVTSLMQSIFCFSAATGDTSVVRHLLEKGADPNTKDKQGHTALMFATIIGAIEIVRILLAAGANPALRSANNETAATLAQNFAHTGQVLAEYGRGSIKRNLGLYREVEALFRAEEEKKQKAVAAPAQKPAQ